MVSQGQRLFSAVQLTLTLLQPQMDSSLWTSISMAARDQSIVIYLSRKSKLEFLDWLTLSYCKTHITEVVSFEKPSHTDYYIG